MSSTALITGATGFVGAHLTRRLLDRGWRVVAAVRDSSDVDRLPATATLSWRCIDGTVAGYQQLLADTGPDVVFHLAARFVGQHRPEHVADLVASNVQLGTELLEAMVATGTARIVTASTIWRRHDGSDVAPVNLYAATKAAFEPILGYYAAAHGLKTSTLELADTYGPDDPRGKVVSVLIDAALQGTELRLSPGEQQLDLTHVDDVTEAFELAAARLTDAGQGTSEHFHALSGRPLSLREVARAVEEVVGRPVRARWGDREYRTREVMVPRSQRPRLPGWRADIDLHEGIRTLLR